MLPLLAGTWMALNGTFSALSQAAELLQVRSAHGMTPVSVANPPRELSPFLRAMNDLLTQLRVARSREREFTAMAAHELRTPLATIRVQAQVVPSRQWVFSFSTTWPAALACTRSCILPITILAGLPSAAVGALGPLMIFGQDLTLIDTIGILLLIGIVEAPACRPRFGSRLEVKL